MPSVSYGSVRDKNKMASKAADSQWIVNGKSRGSGNDPVPSAIEPGNPSTPPTIRASYRRGLVVRLHMFVPPVRKLACQDITCVKVSAVFPVPDGTRQGDVTSGLAGVLSPAWHLRQKHPKRIAELLVKPYTGLRPIVLLSPRII